MKLTIKNDDSVSVELDTAGGNVEVKSLVVTENGSYSEENTAYSPVSVAVPQGWMRSVIQSNIYQVPDDPSDPESVVTYYLGIAPISFGNPSTNKFILATFDYAPGAFVVSSTDVPNNLSDGASALGAFVLFDGTSPFTVDIKAVDIEGNTIYSLFSSESVGDIPELTIYLYERQV